MSYNIWAVNKIVISKYFLFKQIFNSLLFSIQNIAILFLAPNNKLNKLWPRFEVKIMFITFVLFNTFLLSQVHKKCYLNVCEKYFSFFLCFKLIMILCRSKTVSVTKKWCVALQSTIAKVTISILGWNRIRSHNINGLFCPFHFGYKPTVFTNPGILLCCIITMVKKIADLLLSNFSRHLLAICRKFEIDKTVDFQIPIITWMINSTTIKLLIFLSLLPLKLYFNLPILWLIWLEFYFES